MPVVTEGIMFMEAQGQAAVGKKGAGWDGTPWSVVCKPKAIQGCEEPLAGAET